VKNDLPRLAPEALLGLAGKVVAAFEPHTEAAPAAILMQFLVAFGGAAGPGPHFHVGEVRHHTNEFLALVGRTAHARKGDSKAAALRTLTEADPVWASQIASGLSSGEGLIHAVRDPVEKQTNEGLQIVDTGVSDKRMLVVESEFSGPLKQFAREGNILSNVLRDAWDAKHVLRTLTKTSATKATGAHVSLIAHTTPEDLGAYLADVEAANGLGNRFIFILTARVKLLPNPSRIDPDVLADLVKRVRAALDLGRMADELRRSEAAEDLWAKIYPELTKDTPGLLGNLLARGEAHVARLSAIYALLDESPVIDVVHLKAALAVWDYAVESTRRIFGQRTGDKIADRILGWMPPGQEMTVTDIRDEIFSNHVPAAGLKAALQLLRDLGEIRIVEDRDTDGRPAQKIVRVAPAEATKPAA
jgi:hypothetical protein